MALYHFPKWANKLTILVLLVVASAPAYVFTLLYYGGRPTTTDVGYAPKQPVPYSHAVHVGELGMDCRYCHNTVEQASHAAIPPTQTCMNCHNNVRANSELLLPVRESIATGNAVEWVKIHDLPDYAYFNHSAHVQRGVSCVSCHGRIDRLDVVSQKESLSMGWCLDCHRNPEKHIRPVDKVYELDWQPENQIEQGLALIEKNNIKPSTDCSTCHR